MERLKDALAIAIIVILVSAIIILSVMVPEIGLAVALGGGLLVLTLIVTWAGIRVSEIMGL